jgi:NADH:ubiquinone oxidoreductase subunit F (NADH-binding)
MPDKIQQMREAHQVLYEFPFEIKELKKGYSDRVLRIDLDKNEIKILPVTQQMKDLWIGGKGFDLWLMFLEIDKDTLWNSPGNPICFSSGPLGGTTSFPGSGKTLVTTISPITQSIMDCNVGGYFGPFLKFAGFDSLVIVGKAKDETIIFIDAVNKKMSIEQAPLESVDSHLAAEELTEMYADNEMDMRNIAVVSSGSAARHSRMGILNFSFWDWRRKVARLKQAGRGGIGTVFRDKNLKALVIKNRDITPAWRVHENKAAARVTPAKISTQCQAEVVEIDAVIEKWNNDPECVIEMMLAIQKRFRYISKTAIERLQEKTGSPKAYIYHIATFYKAFSLMEKAETGETEKVPAKMEFLSKPPVFALRSRGDGSYGTLKKVLAENNPEGIIKEVILSGLRGRGGGGFPVGLKWEAGLAAGKEKNEAIYIVCNAAGNPVDMSILENDPHSLIEGMLIGAFAAGAREGFIYIQNTYAAAAEKLESALAAARDKGYVGAGLPGSGFYCDIKIRRGAGDFLGGESTALLKAVSGRAGEPEPKYVHNTEHGYHGQPTILDNVETWVNVPIILEKGAAWFAAVGSGDVSESPWNGSSGTKVFSLSGDIAKPGLVEVPMGTTLREIIDDLGGGTTAGRKLKAVQIGGPSGGYIPAGMLDIKMDFDSLSEAGMIMGTGDIAVIDERTSMVEAARRCLEFLAGESCGKCTPCREGLFALKNTLIRISSGEGKEEDIEFLEETAKTVKETSLCRFGGTAPNPVLTTLKYFREDYETQTRDKRR